jgi:hypothetical protein
MAGLNDSECASECGLPAHASGGPAVLRAPGSAGVPETRAQGRLGRTPGTARAGVGTGAARARGRRHLPASPRARGTARGKPTQARAGARQRARPGRRMRNARTGHAGSRPGSRRLDPRAGRPRPAGDLHRSSPPARDRGGTVAPHGPRAEKPGGRWKR